MAKLNAEEVANMFKQTNGNMAAAARGLGVARVSLWSFVQKRPKLQELLSDLRESFKDNAESALYSAVLAGELTAIIFYLKTQAKDRGYVERQQIEQGIEVRQRVVEEVVDGPTHRGDIHQAAPGTNGVQSQ
jgi:hypothetical protein